MGKFAQTASRYDAGGRGDGRCVSGKWIAENLDEDDLAEFVRLSQSHKWGLISRISEFHLKESTLKRHVHGECGCFNDVPALGCCTSCQPGGL